MTPVGVAVSGLAEDVCMFVYVPAEYWSYQLPWSGLPDVTMSLKYFIMCTAFSSQLSLGT